MLILKGFVWNENLRVKTLRNKTKQTFMSTAQAIVLAVFKIFLKEALKTKLFLFF